MSTRINTQFALGLFLVTALGGGVAGGLWWWKERHNSAAAREARGDHEAARGMLLAKAGQADAADAAYVEACNQYGLALQQDINRPSTLAKFKNLTIELITPTYGDALAWANQHLIACRHIAFTSQDPRALPDFYRHILRLADETEELELCRQLHQTADNDFHAFPGHTVSQCYRGVTALRLLGAPKARWNAKDKAQLLALAKKDLETVQVENPADPVVAGHLALLRLYEIMALPDDQRLGKPALRLARDALAILAKAQARTPDDLPLAVMAARVEATCTPLTGESAAPAVRRAVDMARRNRAALEPMDLRYLCRLACTTLTRPARPNPRLPGHTEGQQLAMDMAQHAVAARPQSTLALLALGDTQSFAGDYAASIATFERSLVSPQRLSVADRMVFEAHRPTLLFLLAHNQINLASTRTGANREQLSATANATIDRVHAYPFMATKAMVLKAQVLQLAGHHEEAASLFDRSLREDPALASPTLLHAAALCHARCGNLGGAKELLEASLKLDASRASTHLLLATVMLQMGASERAIAPHLQAAHTPDATALSADLALRGGRFEEAFQTLNAFNPLEVLPQRAAALRALGHGETARDEAMSLLREAPTSAQRVYAVCLALEPVDQAKALREAQAAGLSPEDTKRVRAALAKAIPEANALDRAPPGLGPAPDADVTAALAAWRKQDWAGFEQAAAKHPDQPEILSHRIELAVLRRDWAGARQLIKQAQDRDIELSVGSGAALTASITAMEALESGRTDLTRVIADLHQAAIECPASVGIWDLLTSVRLAADQPVAAVKSAEAACRLQPHSANRLRMLLQCRLQAGDATSDVLQDLRQRAEELPFNDNLRELWLTNEEVLGDAKTVETARLARMREVPADFVNALRLANLFIRANRQPEARILLLKMVPYLAGNPQTAPEAAMELASTLGRGGFADDARLVLRQSLSTIPGFPPARRVFMQAVLEGSLGDPVAEAKAWQAALDQEPRDSRPASYAYANRLIATHRLPEAIAFLRDLSAKLPEQSRLGQAFLSILANTLGMDGQYGQVTRLAEKLPALDALILRTRIAMSTQDDAQAMTLSQQATDLAPANPAAWILRGQVLACDPLRETTARQAVHSALELAPTNADARQLEASLDAQTGHYRVAINRLWRNLALNPGHTQSLNLLTELLLREQDVAGAGALSLAGLQRNPDDLNYLRVAARSEMQRWREIHATGFESQQAPVANRATAFQTQVYRQTEGPMDMAALVSILIETNRPEQALNMLTHLAPDARKMPRLLAIRALALHQDARVKEAQATFAEAFQACTENNAVAECLRQAAKAYGPQEALRLARLNFGQQPATFARLGMGLFAVKTLPQEAIAELTPLLSRTDPDAATRSLVHGAIGAAQEHLGREQEAAKHYRLAIQGDPRDSVSLNNLANILLRRPALALDPEEGLEVARRASFAAARAAGAGALPLRELAAVRDTLGMACERRGNRQEALSIYNGILDVFPLPETHLHLGLLMAADQKDTIARVHYEKAARLADLSGQKRLAAEARWRLNPGDFATNVEYATLLAGAAPEEARPLTETCLKMARQNPPPPAQVATLMRLCREVWPKPEADGFAHGLHVAADIAADIADDRPAQGEYRLLAAVAQECLGRPAWEAELTRGLTRMAEAGPSPWTPRAPQNLPLPDISANAAINRLPDSLWFLSRNTVQDTEALLLLAPESKPIRGLLQALAAQLRNEHGEALESLGALGGQPPLATVRRLQAISLAALDQPQAAVERLAPLADSPQGTVADRIRLLALLRRLDRPEADIRQTAEAAMRQDPACAAAKEVLGDLALAHRDWAGALALYADLPPKQTPAAAVKAATALRRLGRTREADEMLQNHFTDNPTDPWLFEALLRSEPDAKLRQAYFEQAIGAGLNPDLIYAFEHQWHLKVPGVDTLPATPAATTKPTPNQPPAATPPPATTAP